MDYARHYEALMQRARLRIAPTPSESHHVIPRCMGGADAGNIVELTPEEHFVAHQLLTKMHPESRGLAMAAGMMANYRNAARGTNKAYGWLKRRRAEAQVGLERTSLAREAISRGHRSSEKAKAARALVSAGRVGLKHSDETRQKMRTARRSQTISAETRKKIAAGNRGKLVSAETRAKLSTAMKGKRNAAGVVRSPETRLKMSIAKRARA